MSTSPTVNLVSSKKTIYGFAGAALGSVGGFLFGIYTSVVATTSSVPVSYAPDLPFIFAMGAAAIGFFVGYAEAPQ